MAALGFDQAFIRKGDSNQGRPRRAAPTVRSSNFVWGDDDAFVGLQDYRIEHLATL